MWSYRRWDGDEEVETCGRASAGSETLAERSDIEVYDRYGNHLGSMHPLTGELYKPPVKGRTINVK